MTKLSEPDNDVINFLDYWNVVLKYKMMIVVLVVLVSIAAVIVSLVLPKAFKAEATIFPIMSKSGGGLGQVASQFSGLAQLAGINFPGQGGEAEKFMAILRSRTLTETVVRRENLLPILFEKRWDEKLGKWKSSSSDAQPTMEEAVAKMKLLVVPVDDKKNKVIKISGEFRDPYVAARVVNAYVDELQKFINDNSLTAAKRNRIFIEGQLAENKQALLEAGKSINDFYKTNRISSSEAKVDVPVHRGYGVEIQENPQSEGVSEISDNASQQINAETIDATVVMASLAEQRSELEKRIAGAKVVKNVPQQVYLTYLMLHRELLGKVNALLTTQYEMAKIEEAKEDLAFQIIDNAVPPIKRASPKRAQICIMSFMAALFGSIFLAFFREYLQRMKAQAGHL